MKKALVILLILAVAGGAFAQLSVTGSILSGAVISFDNGPTVNNPGPMFSLYSMDSAKAARLNLMGKYTNADGTVGSSFQFRIDGAPHFNDGIPAANAIIQHAYGWVKVFDGMVTINAGKIDNGYSFGTNGGNASFNDIGAGYGLFAIVSPITGLDIGVAAYTKSFAEDVKLVTGRYHFGVSYTMPDTVKVTAQLRQGNNYTYNMTDAFLGVDVLALKNIGLSALSLDTAFLDLRKSTPKQDYMTVKIGERVVYTQDTLEVGGRFIQALQLGTTKSEYSPDMTFHVWGQYAFGAIVPRLDVLFNIGTAKAGYTAATDPTIDLEETNASHDGYDTATYVPGAAEKNVDYRRWDSLSKEGFNKDAKNLAIRPSVQFQFGGSNANFIELGYALNVDLTTYAKPEDIPVTMYHGVYVDYKFSF